MNDDGQMTSGQSEPRQPGLPHHPAEAAPAGRHQTFGAIGAPRPGQQAGPIQNPSASFTDWASI